jgi:hypothetical protein
MLMVLGARADVFSDAQSSLVCTVQYFGIDSKMSSAKSDLLWESGEGRDSDSLLVALQMSARDNAARITFIHALPVQAKGLFLAAAKGQPIADEQKALVSAAIAERSTQILVPFGADDSLYWDGEMYGQQLQISCLPK